MAHVFDLLKQDHRTVERLFEEFERSGDPQTAHQICEELSVHATLEEEMVYPLLRAKVAAGMADEARDEHQEAKTIIARIYGMGSESGDGELKAAVGELKQVIQHHVEEEETEIFPKMEKDLPDTIGVLGNEVEHRKKELQRLSQEKPGSVSDKATPSGRGS